MRRAPGWTCCRAAARSGRGGLPGRRDPCKHSAAACYLVSDALDADPFVLLLLRGRAREQVLAGVRARRRGEAAVASSGTMPEVRGTAEGRRGADSRRHGSGRQGGLRRFHGFVGCRRSRPRRYRPPVPVSPRRFPWTHRHGATAWAAASELAADAASRAWELAVGLTVDAGLGLSLDADLARRASRVLGTPEFRPLPSRSGVGARELAREALAWRHGGLAGLELLHAEWDPVDPEVADLIRQARAVLSAKTGAVDSVERNRITAGRLQLRLGRDLRWYPYAVRTASGSQAGRRKRTRPGRSRRCKSRRAVMPPASPARRAPAGHPGRRGISCPTANARADRCTRAVEPPVAARRGRPRRPGVPRARQPSRPRRAARRPCGSGFRRQRPTAEQIHAALVSASAARLCGSPVITSSGSSRSVSPRVYG